MPRARSRRAVLSLGAAALASLAGCTAADSDSGPRSPTTGTTLETTASKTTTDETTIYDDYRRIEILVNPADPADIADAVVREFSDLTDAQRQVVSDAVADGEHVHTTHLEKPLDGDTYVAYDGAYYRVAVEVAAERERTAHDFRLDAISNCDHRHDEAELATARKQAVAFEDLPEADRQAFALTSADTDRGGACFSAGFYYVFESESAAERSVLVSEDPTYVEYGGDTFLVEFHGTQSVVESDYRYTAERIARNEAELHDVLARDVAIHLRPEDLPDDERRLLDELTDGSGYGSWKNPIPEHVDSLSVRIRSHDPHGDSRKYFLRYRGDYYELEHRETVA